MINYEDQIENGTVDPNLPSYATKYSISTSDVYDAIPGATSYQNFDVGASIVKVDLQNVSIFIEKDWTNRRSLSNQDKIILKNGNLTKILRFNKIYPASHNSSPATKIVFSEEVTAQDLFDFVGLTGSPSAIGTAYLSLDPQNEYIENNLSSDFVIQKNVTSFNLEEFSVDFSWINSYSVKKNIFRWRAVPFLKRYSEIFYSILDPGEYTEIPSAVVNSDWGSGEIISLSGAIKRIEVLSGGNYSGTPTLTASYPGATGASFSVGMSGNSIVSITVVSGGSGYNSSPTLTLTGATEISAASLVAFLEIQSVTVDVKGYDYLENPTISITGGSGASGSIGATVQVINAGRIDYVSVINSGSGYEDGTEVIFTGGGGTGALGVLQVLGGTIQSIKMIDHGYGYISSPTAIISGTGSSASLQPVVSLYADWNYVNIDPDNPGYTLEKLNKYLEYEWQVYSSPQIMQGFVSYTPLQKFKFF